MIQKNRIVPYAQHPRNGNLSDQLQTVLIAFVVLTSRVSVCLGEGSRRQTRLRPAPSAYASVSHVPCALVNASGLSLVHITVCAVAGSHHSLCAVAF